MKKIDVNQMEKVEGGISVYKDCALRGLGVALSIGLNFFGPAIGILATSGHCYTFN